MAADALAPYVARTSAAMILTDYLEYVGPGLSRGIWSNDIKCKYMFMFSLENLACKGLRNRRLTIDFHYSMPAS